MVIWVATRAAAPAAAPAGAPTPVAMAARAAAISTAKITSWAMIISLVCSMSLAPSSTRSAWSFNSPVNADRAPSLLPSFFQNASIASALCPSKADNSWLTWRWASSPRSSRVVAAVV
ncbi:hypothetical protein [Nocardia cyriacigeorgica]|uniref:hypothetical protein n=1 Tax=Nocardia cyriacigeorgica TaxID=135487 RepID=UPI0024557A93|nr:hypothetical protein [Nocardia cyriacigeorgica]